MKYSHQFFDEFQLQNAFFRLIFIAQFYYNTNYNSNNHYDQNKNSLVPNPFIYLKKFFYKILSLIFFNLKD